MKIFPKQKGFTLIELLVVIAIMATLSAVIYASFGAARATSRDEKRVSDLSAIQLSLAQYLNKNGQYPTSTASLVPGYIAALPTPPTGGAGTTGVYAYNYFPITQVRSNSTVCTTYQLWTTLENTNAYLSSKIGFNSTAIPTSGMWACSGSSGVSVNASTTALVYDVMPR